MHAFMELLIIGLVSVQVSVLITRNKPWGQGRKPAVTFLDRESAQSTKKFFGRPPIFWGGGTLQKNAFCQLAERTCALSPLDLAYRDYNVPTTSGIVGGDIGSYIPHPKSWGVPCMFP